MEQIVTDKRITRITVDLMRPIPMEGFRVRASVAKTGRLVSVTGAELFDDDGIYASARGLHLRELDHFPVSTAAVPAPDFEASRPGPFPIQATHGMTAFVDSVECRYDPSTKQGGGPTTIWMRTKIPLLRDENPSPFQRICPLADCLNGVSFNDPIDDVWFVNADITLSLHRDPTGQWFCAQAVSMWEPSGIGLAHAALFDTEGPVGRATQNVLLTPADG